MKNSGEGIDRTDVEMATDRLWSWKFELVDWVGMSIAIALLVANAIFLFRADSAFIRANGLLLAAPWVNCLFVSVWLIIKPNSNSTRIPAVFLILVSVAGIAINVSQQMSA